MAQMLLINPRKRPGRTAKRKSARRVRRHNPVTVLSAAPKRRRRLSAIRRHNPIGLKRVHRRRRNPISLGGGAGIAGMLKSAAIGGAGAVAVDVLMGQLEGYLPASMKRTPGTLGVGDAVKIGVAILAGKGLNKMTRGMSMKMAVGSLTVQARDIIASFVPASMPLGYSASAPIVQGSHRIGPNQMRVGAFQHNSGTPLLSAFNTTGARSPLLGNAATREGVRFR